MQQGVVNFKYKITVNIYRNGILRVDSHYIKYKYKV